MRSGHRRSKGILLLVALAVPIPAQSVFEQGDRVVYEDAKKQPTDLGAGFSPILTADGKVALLRGHKFGYGDRFDCGHRATKNWVALYDPATRRENTIFDRRLEFERPEFGGFCIFEQMQLSRDAQTLYLVSLVYATSGSLAIVSLATGSVSYVPGVDFVYVIQSGPHRDELIYQRRVMHATESPRYPFIHANANGKQITEISDEYFTVGGNDKLPILRAYLRKIDATISINGRIFP